jgi:hypothetical protein
MSRLIRLAALALASLYLTVWPHELGHAIAAYRLGCKADWWSTYTRLLLAGSGPGAIRLRCLAARGPDAMAVVAGAGIAVNLVLLAAALAAAHLALRRGGAAARSTLVLAAVVLALTEGAEAFSYLVLNGLLPRADVALLISTTGLEGWVWTAAGLLFLVPTVLALRRPLASAAATLAVPGAAGTWRRVLVAGAVALTLFIGAYRVVAHPAPTPGMAGFEL